MATFIMLTRLSPDALRSPKTLEELERATTDTIRNQCPEVEWVASFAVMGGCDYMDVFHAPDMTVAMKVATIVRTFGHASTEVWGAVEWRKFKEVIRHLPGAAGLITSR